MKTKIALVVALGALFVAVPSATPKGGRPAGVQWGFTCNELVGPPDADTCNVTVTGLSAKGQYTVGATNSCGGVDSGSGTVTGADLGTTGVIITLDDCEGSWVFSLYSVGKGGAPTFVTSIDATAHII